MPIPGSQRLSRAGCAGYIAIRTRQTRPGVARRPARQSDRDARRRQIAAPTVMLFAHMDQLGLSCARSRPTGSSGSSASAACRRRRCRRRRCCSASARARTCLASSPTRAITRRRPRKNTKSCPIADLYIDCGFASAEEARAAGIDIGTPVVYAPRAIELANGRIAGTVGRRPRRLRRACSKWRARLKQGRHAADHASRLLGAGGIQPARRGHGGAGAACPTSPSSSTSCSPPTRPTWPSAATCGSAAGRP